MIIQIFSQAEFLPFPFRLIEAYIRAKNQGVSFIGLPIEAEIGRDIIPRIRIVSIDGFPLCKKFGKSDLSNIGNSISTLFVVSDIVG